MGKNTKKHIALTRLNCDIPKELMEKLDFIAHKRLTQKTTIVRQLIAKEYEAVLREELEKGQL